jgi:hypothetical protein
MPAQLMLRWKGHVLKPIISNRGGLSPIINSEPILKKNSLTTARAGMTNKKSQPVQLLNQPMPQTITN